MLCPEPKSHKSGFGDSGAGPEGSGVAGVMAAAGMASAAKWWLFGVSKSPGARRAEASIVCARDAPAGCGVEVGASDSVATLESGGGAAEGEGSTVPTGRPAVRVGEGLAVTGGAEAAPTLETAGAVALAIPMV